MMTALTALLLLLSGCYWSRPGSISPCTVALPTGKSYTLIQQNVRGTDSALLLLTFPITHPDTEAALQDILNTYNADGLINVTVDTAYFSLLFLTLEKTTIQGDAIKIQNIN